METDREVHDMGTEVRDSHVLAPSHITTEMGLINVTVVYYKHMAMHADGNITVLQSSQ